MRKETLNGTPIPYDLPTEELGAMMSSSIMQDFSLACEALSYKNDPDAYRIMKSHANDKDKYRRLYVLKTIFRHPEAVELVDLLENAIASDDALFVENGLLVIADYQIKVSAPLLLAALDKHLPQLYMAIRAAGTLDVSDEHYAKLVRLFKKAQQCSQKEFFAQILIEHYLPAKSEELFDLFCCDSFAKIRLLGLEIARQYGYPLSPFLSDMDGHVKKLMAQSLGELSFLTAYASKYRVDVSDDLESAIIYNPHQQEHLYVEYDSADDFSPFTLCFSFQHVHLPDRESAAEWIDDILHENIFSIEYFKGENRHFGGQISAADLANLSYELLEQKTGYYGSTKLYALADCFKVRGWTQKNDFDGYFVKKADGTQIRIVPVYQTDF